MNRTTRLPKLTRLNLANLILPIEVSRNAFLREINHCAGGVLLPLPGFSNSQLTELLDDY